jgi:hypothetical protein
MRCFSLLVVLVLSLSACTTELPLPGGGTARKVTLVGELTAGDTIHIRAGQSAPLLSGGILSLIEGLQVSIKTANGVITPLSGMMDGYSGTLYTIPFSASLQLAAGNTYEIEAKHADLGSVNATVYIPKAFDTRLHDQDVIFYKGDSALRFDISLEDANAATGFYVIEAVKQSLDVTTYFSFGGAEYVLPADQSLYDSLRAAGVSVSERNDTLYSGFFTRLNLGTADGLSDNASASVGQSFSRIFFQGKLFGANSHRTQVMIPMSEVRGLPEPVQIVLRVKSVSPDYYDFLKAYQQYDGSIGYGTNSPPTNLPGNVKGGLGMIGGVYLWQMAAVY